MNTRRISVAALSMLAATLVALPSHADAQSSGRYELEYEGPVMGGVTGVGASVTESPGQFVIVLPAVVRSYPTIRFERSGPLPGQPFQAAVGSGASDFTVRFSHPDLPESYVGEAGAIRITEVAERSIRGDFAVVASPAGSPGTRTLTFRGRFEVPRR